MSKKSFGVLQLIKNEHKITRESDPVFLYTLQQGLLLALREHNLLSEMQYRGAVSQLKAQQAEYVKKHIREWN